MYCPKCLNTQPYEGPCEQCDEPVLPDDVPNPYWDSQGLRFQKWQIVLVTLTTIVGVLYFLKWF